ncbi:MAG: SCO family protein [candidate division FCPU426 bacterium]
MEKTLKLRVLAYCSLALLAGAIVWTVRHRSTRGSVVALEKLGRAPEFHLIDQTGASFDSADLIGKVWVASFIYTSCPDVCPMLGAKMKRIAASMPAGDGFRMVSISVDPKKDTPQRMSRYASDLGVTDPRWYFLTGKEAEIHDLVLHGFMLPDMHPNDKQGEILHSPLLVLVDKKGQIRAYYNGLFEESVEQIQRAGGSLLAEK